MAFDAHKNFAVSSVAVAPSPAASGTSLTVTSGDGARFPAAPFNGTVCPAGTLPTPANAEIVRVTAIAGDVLTIVRAQESTTARAIAIGDLIAATITAKTVTDLESGTNFPQLTTPGFVTTAVGVVGPGVSANTPDGADNAFISLAGGGGASNNRGATIHLLGNENAQSGRIQMLAGDPNGRIEVYTGATLLRGVMHASGGFSWGDATDPGATNLRVAGTIAERGRTVPMGEWVDVPFNAANFSAAGGGTWTVGSAAINHNRYTLIGKTLFWRFYISWFSGSNTVAGTVTSLKMTVPSGFALLSPQIFTGLYAIESGTGTRIAVDVNAAGTLISVDKVSGTNWAAGSPGFVGTVVFEAN